MDALLALATDLGILTIAVAKSKISTAAVVKVQGTTSKMLKTNAVLAFETIAVVRQLPFNFSGQLDAVLAE